MDIINEKLLIELYSEYINDRQYVYYKEHNAIIIMKKMSDDNKCISNVKPKKYHSSNLKVILMFDIIDPYKLVSSLTKYKMNELTESYYYDNIKEAYTLEQTYYESGQLEIECNYIDNNYHGLYLEYLESGQLYIECHYENGKLNGLFKLYSTSGKIIEECHYENGILKN